MARKRSELEEERMTDTNILRVIGLLEPAEEGTKPITKKVACEILGMSYNTTRLDNIIKQFKEKRERDAKRRAEKRGKPATPDEIKYAISEYLTGGTIDGISKSLYRSAAFIKTILDKYSVPMRKSSPDYFHPELLPESSVRDRFKVGEVVYSARYDSVARIMSETENHPRHGWVYRIWLLSDKWLQNAYQPAHELASLEHLREVGVDI